MSTHLLAPAPLSTTLPWVSFPRCTQKAATHPWIQKMKYPRHVSLWKPKSTYWSMPLVWRARPLFPSTNMAPPTTVQLSEPIRFPFSITSIGNVSLVPIWMKRCCYSSNTISQSIRLIMFITNNAIMYENSSKFQTNYKWHISSCTFRKRSLFCE